MLPITGLGLASSLGGMVTAAAAYRAGISRGQRLDHLPMPTPEDDESCVVGHEAWPPAEVFEYAGTWIRLLEQALADLRATAVPDQGLWERMWQEAALALVLPVMDGERFPCSTDDGQVLDSHVLVPLCARLGVVPPSVRSVFPQGHAGFAAAWSFARDAIASGRCRRCLVLAVDSLLDRLSVEWLSDQGRLKLPGNPHGLMPGEAAVALLLETPGDTIGQPTGASILEAAVEVALPPADDAESQREPPVAAAQRLIAALNRVHPSAADPLAVDHYVDLNGEAWRAQVWGYAQPLVRSRLVADRGRVWHPAEGFGDTGAASGALACLLAVRSWVRGYAGADQALIWSLAEDGAAGIVRLGRG